MKTRILFLMLCGVFGLTASAHAAIFTVTNASDSGTGSLRQAVTSANSNPGMDEIHFNITGSDLIVNLDTPLPWITDPVSINGTTQSGSNCSMTNRFLPLQVILAQQVNSPSVFVFSPGSSGSHIKGLTLASHPNDHGILIGWGTSNVSVTCNNIGVNSSGSLPNLSSPGNGGILIRDSNHITIGGSGDAANIIGNYYVGIDVHNNAGVLSEDIRIKNNRIGVNAFGTAVVNSAGCYCVSGISLVNVQNVDVDEGNIIAGYDDGINMGNVKDIAVRNNRIGVGTNGGALSNDESGIIVFGGRDVAVEGNIIAHNQEKGIALHYTETKNVHILSNRISQNGALGIDLNSDGVTYNDDGDDDEGTNHLLNFPILTSTELAGNQLKIKFDLDVDTANTHNFRIEFFANPSGLDPSGHGEGEIYLGFVNVASFGQSTHTATIQIPAGIDLNDVKNITSTTTEVLQALDDGSGSVSVLYGSTSEFSSVAKKVFYDFGDAPDDAPGTGPGNFRTKKYDLGPSHKAGGVYLGSCVDGDDGTKANYEAQADDADVSLDVLGTCVNGDDEDGVIFLESTLSNGQIAHVNVTASAQGYLNAWVDWNHDGTFSNMTEKIFSNKLLIAGNNALTFMVPDNTSGSGHRHARFRVNTTGNLSSIGGPAADGEVEDYRITVGERLEGPGGGETQKWSPTSAGTSR